jgi:hypothetical protein
MSLPRIMVVRGSNFSSRAIAGFGAGRWSHMANVLADGSILDARYDHVEYEGAIYPTGVEQRPKGYLDDEEAWELYEFGTPKMYAPWLSALRSQIGKPYDSLGIWDFAKGLFTGKYKDQNYDPGKPDQSKAWFCDALAVFGASWGCHYLTLPEDFTPYTLTPGAALDLFIGRGARLIASKGTS